MFGFVAKPICIALSVVTILSVGCGRGEIEDPPGILDLKTAFTNSLGIEFVPIEGLDNVLFAKHPIRNRDYAEFVEAGYRVPEPRSSVRFRMNWFTWEWGRSPRGYGNHPVVNVEWKDARIFCLWLTNKERSEGLIGRRQQYRLPTDWEWSVAVGLNECHSASPSDRDGKIKNVYPWDKGKGTWPPPQGAGNYHPRLKVDGFDFTSPVCAFPGVNANDLCDMGGNVWELCEDSYVPEGVNKVLRGGSWDEYCASALLSSNRKISYPDVCQPNTGFRVVLGEIP